MGPRVHVCSVEREFEPRLPEKLVCLCECLCEIVRTASTMNENTRCFIEGTYLLSTTIKLDGFLHVNDVVRNMVLEECEVAFGRDSATLTERNNPHTITVECTFQEPRKWNWCTLFLKLFVLVACIIFINERCGSALVTIATFQSVVNATAHNLYDL